MVLERLFRSFRLYLPGSFLHGDRQLRLLLINESPDLPDGVISHPQRQQDACGVTDVAAVAWKTGEQSEKKGVKGEK